MPWAIAESDDGRIFLLKEEAQLGYENGRLNPQPVAIISPIFTEAEAGLFGIALDPNFSENGYVYAIHIQ